MDCPTIDHLVLSKRSREAIEDIRRRRQLGNILVVASDAGTLASIFLGNGAVEASFSLYSTDFVTFANAMRAVPDITRNAVSNAARDAWLDAQTSDERVFWKAIYEGCELKH